MVSPNLQQGDVRAPAGIKKLLDRKGSMKLRALGPIIASRRLTDAKGTRVGVQIGKPRRFRGGHPDYYCPFKIKGPAGRWSGAG